MIIPREHVKDYWDADGSLVADLARATVEVGRALRSALNPDGMNLITSAGSTAEQTVFHLHLHVVPRWKADGFGHIWPVGDRYEVDSLRDCAAMIRRAIADNEERNP